MAMIGSLRPLTTADLPIVERIQREAYPRYHKEAIAVFADKLTRYADGCWAYVSGSEMVGYLFSHPAAFADPPRLDEFLPPPATEPDCYFIHDKAVLPTHRGAGAGKLLLTEALAHAAARGFTKVALVAVQDARPYWERYGFEIATDAAPVALVRSSYGPDARYMTRNA